MIAWEVVVLSHQFYDGDAGTSKLWMLIVVVGDGRYGGNVLTNKGAENARACAVKYAHAACTSHEGIVDEVGHGLYSLFASHTAHVDVL